MNAKAPGVTLSHVSQTLGGHAVFKQLTLQLDGGLWHCCLGQSGVGKTTLLRLIAGLDEPQTGQIGDEHGMGLTARVSYMSQDDGLLPWLNVIDNVQLGPRLRRTASTATRRAAKALLAKVDLLPWMDARPDQLSGGMRQRVALARTLLEDRALVLMDEPFSRLDAITRDELQVLASKLLHGRTVVLVTHDPAEALRLGHSIHVLQSVASEPGSTNHHTRIVRLNAILRTQTSELACSSDIDSAQVSSSADTTAGSAMTELWSLLKASHHAS